MLRIFHRNSKVPLSKALKTQDEAEKALETFQRALNDWNNLFIKRVLS